MRLNPIYRPLRTILATLAVFYVGGQLGLVTVCHEWRTFWAPHSGVPFELLYLVGILIAVATLVLLPFATTRAPRRARALHAVAWLLIGADMIVRSIDWVVYYQSGLHLNPMVTGHAHGDGLRWLIGYVPVVQLALPVVVTGLVIFLARRSDALLGRLPALRWRRVLLVPLPLVAIVVVSLFIEVPHVEHASGAPEWWVYRASLMAIRENRCAHDVTCAPRMSLLEETIRLKLTRFGMHVDPHERLPLLKNIVYHQSLPFKKTPAYVAKPNVLVIFMESMSAEFVGVYRPGRPSVTPNLDAFAAQSTRVEHYYNATTPTVTSLVAGLCSFYPPSGNEEFGRMFFGALNCAGDTLAPHGYESMFIRGINKSFAHVGEFLESQRFRVFDQPQVALGLKQKPLSWGFSDHQLFQYLRLFLEARKSATPFFLGMTTVDLHPPFNMTTVPQVVAGPTGRLLNIVHSTDDAFGAFWNWFVHSRFAANTIVIVTADHAVLPDPAYVATRDPSWKKSVYDQIPLFIHAPGYALPSVWTPDIANSVDLLPTILHLLGVNDPNAFEGSSLFDDRHGQTGILGEHTYLLYANQLDAQGHRVVDSFTLHPCSDAEVAKPAYELTECEQGRWHAWTTRLLKQRRIWR